MRQKVQKCKLVSVDSSKKILLREDIFPLFNLACSIIVELHDNSLECSCTNAQAFSQTDFKVALTNISISILEKIAANEDQRIPLSFPVGFVLVCSSSIRTATVLIHLNSFNTFSSMKQPRMNLEPMSHRNKVTVCS